MRTDGQRGSAVAFSLLTGAASIGFFGYEVARAQRVSLTFDEAATYLKYISTDVLSIFNFAYATNQFLNTLLTRVFYSLGGDHDLVLRMAGLIGYAIYLAFGVLILRGLTSRTLAFGGFLLLNLNPYVADYFALCRGYSLALGLLMGAVYFLLRFVRAATDDAPDRRALSLALACAVAAVLANFSLLSAYLGVAVIALVTLVAVNANRRRHGAGNTRTGIPSQPRGRAIPWLPLVAALFTLLVFSQDTGLTAKLYQPIAVTVIGLNSAEQATVNVFRRDPRGNDWPLPRANDVWREVVPAPAISLRIEVPQDVAARLVAIDTTVGRELFTSTPRDPGWTSRIVDGKFILESSTALSLPRSSMTTFDGVLNWGGTRRHLAYVGGYTLIALLLLAAVAVLVKAAGVVMVRTGLLDEGQWRPFATSALWLAALTGAPLYLLQRDAQLYFGGDQGLVRDTFYSVIDNSFYGWVYSPTQSDVVFTAVVASLVVFALIAYVAWRRGSAALVRSGACLLAILAISSGVVEAEHLLLHTPYLTGRTALFFVPVYVLFAAFLCDAVGSFGRVGRAVAVGAMGIAVVCGSYHFSRTANVQATLDWRRDADTKTMIGDLRQMMADERPARSHALLQVSWAYWPAALIYARRRADVQIDVVADPPPDGSAFLYMGEGDEGRPARVFKRYPTSQSVLGPGPAYADAVGVAGR